MNVTDKNCYLPAHALLLVLLGTTYAAHSEPLSGTDFVAETAALLASEVTARNPGLATSFDVQELLVEEILRPRFDLARSSELILRDYWREAPTAVQQLFETTFYYYLVATYGDALHWFRDDTLTLMAEQAPEFSKSHAVKTLLKLHDGQTHQAQFYLQRSGERWFVIDVIVDGVSYARTYSSDFRSIIRQDGLDGLIGWLADMANEHSSAPDDQ